jgi:hypothetical protein
VFRYGAKKGSYFDDAASDNVSNTQGDDDAYSVSEVKIIDGRTEFDD